MCFKKFLYSLVLLLLGCSSEHNTQSKENLLVVLNNSDSIETGFWTVENDQFEKSGVYEDGLKVGTWIYKNSDNSRIDTLNWNIHEFKGLLINYPDELELQPNSNSQDMMMFDIVDSNRNTFIVLLSQKKEKIGLKNAQEFISLLNQRRVQSGNLVSKKGLIYSMCDMQVYYYEYEESIDNNTYLVKSYILEDEDYLYDLTFKNKASAVDDLGLEMLKDMLYSLNLRGNDIFTFGNSRIHKVDTIRFINELTEMN